MPQLQPRLTPTFKQKQFAREYIKNNGNGTKAALKVYDANYDTAQSIASVNLDKPAVINEINRILENTGLTDDQFLADRIITAIDSGIGVKATNKDAIQALNMLLKVKNAYPVSKKMTMHVSLKGKLSQNNVSETLKKVEDLTQQSNKLMADLRPTPENPQP